MAGAISDLTDKEKEALRLLLAGHDAKSSAARLDISVHTINDRLRSARRKMGVSSSREAARILGDTEGSAPQSAAHNVLGMAGDDSAGDNADLANTGPAGPSRAAWLTGGMLTMSIAIAVAALTFIFTYAEEPTVSNGLTPAQEQAAPAAVNDAVSLARAQAFIAQVDAGDWEESWEIAGGFFQSQVTVAEWAAAVDPVRTPLGAVRSRELISVQRASTLPGAPEGEYEVLQFQTAFAGRAEAGVETLIMLEGQNGWEVVGYFVR